MISKKLKLSDKKLYEKYKNYIENYAPVMDYIKDQNLVKETKYKYVAGFALYCCSQDKELEVLLKEAQKEEKDNVPLDERKLTERLNWFEEYLEKDNYAEKSIRVHKKNIRAFYRRNNISLPEDDDRNLMNPKIRNHIKNSEIFENFKDQLNLENTGTIDGYLTSLTGYCEYNDMTIEELIEEAEDEEERRVRKSKRKIKNRLIKYRKHLYTKYANSTVSTKMSDIVYFYVINDIEIPDLPKPNIPYEPQLSFDEIPTKEHVKRALETTTSIKNRALYLFCMTSGASSAEARELSVKEYLQGSEYYHHEKEDIQKALEKMDGKNDIVPVFHLVRVKKKKDYYSCITPEANQFIINYLKERENLTLDDKVFDYSRKGVTNAFQYVNDVNNWGWVKNNRQRFFTCHQMRRLNANIIDDIRLVDMIQGRKYDATTEAYFKRDPKKIRKKYLKYVPELTIYEKFKTIWLTDEEYNKLSKELKEKDELLKKQDEKIAELENNYDNLSERMIALSKSLKHLDRYEPIDSEIKSSLESYIRNIADETRLHWMNDEKIKDWYENEANFVERTLLHCESNILDTLVEISYEIATTEEKYDGTNESASKIVEKAIYRLKDNEDLMIKVEIDKTRQNETLEKIELLEELIKERFIKFKITDEKEQERILNAIINDMLYERRILDKEVNGELAYDLIADYME